MDDLVSTDWLAANLNAADVVPVDCTWFMSSAGRDPRAEFAATHIPGARYFDIDAVSDAGHPAPHMLPPAENFTRAMSEAGIGSNDRIVVYDNSPLRTAVRGWFMLRHFGADQVAVLDGGLGKWLAEGRPTESGEPRNRPVQFEARERAGEVVSLKQVRAGLGVPLVDARGRARFEGYEADPRPGVGTGHIPGSRNLPYAELYNPDGTMKSREEIRRLFLGAGVDPEKPFVASCGSGVTANSLILAARLLGNRDTRLYDGSWSEWGADPTTPKDVGAP
jgi:thiosulfate/3-mercaptopyruvate sulfurtransferase